MDLSKLNNFSQALFLRPIDLLPQGVLDQALTSFKQVTQGLSQLQSGFDGLKNLANSFQQFSNFPGLNDLTQRLQGGPGQMPGGFAMPPDFSTRNLQNEFSKIFGQLQLPQDAGQQQFNAKMGNALDALDRNFAFLDGAASKNSSKRTDGLISKEDLKSVANNPEAPADLKQACQFLLDNPAAFNELSVASGIGKVDNLIGKTDIQALKSKFPKVDGFTPFSAGTTGPTGTTPSTQAPSQYATALQNLKQNFDLLDTAAGEGKKDGIIGYNDLKKALNNPGLPQGLKDSIKYLLDNSDMLKKLDKGLGSHTPDRKITMGDIDAELSKQPPMSPQFMLSPQLQPSSLFPSTSPASFTMAPTMPQMTPASYGTMPQMMPQSYAAMPQTMPQSYATMPQSYATMPQTTPASYATMPQSMPSYGTAPASYAAAPSASSSGSISSILGSGLSSEGGMLTQQENQMLSQIQDPNQRAMMKAQMELQHAQEVLAFISNVMKKMNEMAMSVINNLK